mgnify:FL=1
MQGGVNIGKYIMKTNNIKIIRSWWGDFADKFKEIPKFPLYPGQEIVYVWGKDNFKLLSRRGYICYLMKDDDYDLDNIYGKKLLVLDKALQDWGEVLMLDWDCYILKPLDKHFYNSLQSKPIQIPLYAHHKDSKRSLIETIPTDHPLNNIKEYSEHIYTTIDNLDKELPKYSWEWNDGLIIPNFGCVYSRDINFGKELIKITKQYNVKGLVEEFATWIYVNCSMEEYVKNYLPTYVLGVSEIKIVNQQFDIEIIQQEFNNHIKSLINYKPYLEHV